MHTCVHAGIQWQRSVAGQQTCLTAEMHAGSRQLIEVFKMMTSASAYLQAIDLFVVDVPALQQVVQGGVCILLQACLTGAALALPIPSIAANKFPRLGHTRSVLSYWPATSAVQEPVKSSAH